MLVNVVSRALPYKSVIWDAVSRDGPPGPDNYPVEGIASRIMEKIHGLPYADVMRKLQEAPDFDYSRPIKNALPASSFKEVDAQRILEYVEQLTFGYRRNEQHGYREYMSNHLMVQRAIHDREENRVFTESDIATDNSDEARREILEIRQKIPYLLKQLHIRSKQLGISLMSVVIANEKFKAKRPDKNIKPVKLAEEGIYYMSKDGNITGQMGAVIGSFPHQLHLWVSGVEGHYDIYYAAVVELLDCCDKIGADLTLEDATKYQEGFINSLQFDYVIKNDDLPLAVESQKSRLTKEALTRVRGMSIDDLALSITRAQIALDINAVSRGNGLAIQALAAKVMGMYLNRMELRKFSMTESEQYLALIKLSTAFSNLNMGDILEHGMYRNDGFYMSRTGAAIIKNISYLGAGGGGVNVIFHDSGYAVLVPSSEENLYSVKCVAFDVLTQALREYVNSKGISRFEWEIL